MTVKTNEKFLKILGKRIANRRRSRELTQAELAKEAKVHRTYIGFIEQGVRNPTILTVKRISVILKVGLDYLLKDL
jgi:transcriptional regulator with XRE-family HTH domain